MRYNVVLLPGDGIGPEVMQQGERVLGEVSARLGIAFDLNTIPCGGKYYLAHGREWPSDAAERCQAADVIFLGAVGWPSPDGPGPVTMPDGRMAGYAAVLGNRTQLDLYANIRPVRLLPGVRHRIHGQHKMVWDADKVDLVLVRENTEGLYAGIGGFIEADGQRSQATDIRIITRRASERIIRRAFDLAQSRGRGAPLDGKRRVTCIAKDNVLRGCQLFVETFQRIGQEYPAIEKDYALVDAFTQWLITEPERYDVCVTTNMFGDIVTDLAAVLQGGMGLAVGCNIGDAHAMFEPIHGSAPTIAGQNRANPMAMILAVGAGLRWLDEKKQHPALGEAARVIEDAVASVILDGQVLTFDLTDAARASTTEQVGTAICQEIARRMT